jgi:hypothetical protein
MKSTIVITLVGSLLVAACGGAAAPPAMSATPGATPAQATLDGTSYDVTLEFPGETPMKDVLRFDRGGFESTACTALGFPKWTQYQAARDGDAISFKVETHNPKGPVVEWAGSVEGAVAQGKAKRTIDGKTDVGTFRGASR